MKRFEQELIQLMKDNSRVFYRSQKRTCRETYGCNGSWVSHITDMPIKVTCKNCKRPPRDITIVYNKALGKKIKKLISSYAKKEKK